MNTRIVMDIDVNTPGKTFIAGAVYDSRFPLDIPPAADGIQHCISQEHLDLFIVRGWAHEQTWDEWASNKPMFKAHFEMMDAIMGKSHDTYGEKLLKAQNENSMGAL